MVVGSSQPIDLKYLLLSLPMKYFSSDFVLSENETDEALSWIVANQRNVTIVLDGLDESSFKVSSFTVSSNVDVHKKCLPSELLFLLLSRNILPDVRLILTSRPHFVLKLDALIQPKFVLFLDDLSETSMMTLMSYYVKTGEVEQIVSKLLEKSPRVQQIIYCPLFLRLFASLVNLVGLNEIWTIVRSTASLFDELLRRLHDSAHYSGEIEGTNALSKIMELARRLLKDRLSSVKTICPV